MTEKLLLEEISNNISEIKLERIHPDIENQPKERFRVFSASDAFKKESPPDWVIEGLFESQDVVVFYGKAGSKKSYSLLDMAICVCLGKSWLETFKTHQAPVLWIDEDNGPRTTHRRVAATIRGHLAEKENIPFFYTSLQNFSATKDIDQLEDLIISRSARLIIIDAWQDILDGETNENASQDVRPIMSNLRSVAKNTNSLIIILHHTNKEGSIRGSTTIEGKGDAMIKVQAKENSSLVTFTTTKTRHMLGMEFFANANFGPKDGPSYFWLTGRDKPIKKRNSIKESVALILDYLSENGEQDTETIYKETGVQKNYFYTEIKRPGLVKRVNEGGAGKMAIYAITENGHLKLKEYYSGNNGKKTIR